MVLKALLKAAIKKLLPQVVSDIKKANCNFGLINLDKHEVVLGITETGEIKIRKQTEEFKGMGGKFKEGLNISDSDINKLLSSILIEIKEDFTLVFVKGEMLGSFEYKFENSSINGIDANNGPSPGEKAQETEEKA